MQKNLFVISCFAVTLAVAPACATKKFVRTEVGQVNDKVTTMGKSLEETQERVRVAEGRITEVDGKAAAAGQSAQQAQQSAQAAQQTGTQAMEVGKTATARAEAVESGQPQADLRDGAERRQGQVRPRQVRTVATRPRPKSTRWWRS